MGKGIFHPFDLVLYKLDFITSSGNIVDLRAIFTDLNIYEDIFGNVISGSLMLSDSTNIFGHLVLQGNEFLQIILDKPGLHAPMYLSMRVYSRGEINHQKLSNQDVKLHFCSQELFVSKAIKLSKTYTNMLISDMVKDIGWNILKIPTKNFPDTNIEPTHYIHTYIVPYYNPFQTLNLLASRANSNYVGATYFFYQNNLGYNFQSLQNLMASQHPIATYNYNMKNVDLQSQKPGISDPNLDFYDVQDYEIINTPDTLHNLVHGKYSGTLMTLDILRQKFDTRYLNGNDLFQSTVKLNNGRPYNNFVDRFGKGSSNSYDSARKFYPTNEGRNQAAYISGKEHNNSNRVDDWLLERKAQVLQMLSIRFKLVIPGNNLLTVGDVIQFNLPSIEPQSQTGLNQITRKLDPHLSGLYLITAIRHHITPQVFTSVLEICSDTYKQSVPTADINNVTIKGLS